MNSEANIPFFSIGVTTYKRQDLLRQCLFSIQNQTFKDFEVIVGNDYPEDDISLSSIGLPEDPRFKILNNKKNLGELENMNMLMRESTGKYFTWIADDDLYALDLFSKVAECISQNNHPECVYTSFKKVYGLGDIEPFLGEYNNCIAERMTGPEFMRDALREKIKTIACMGFYRRDFMKGIGGFPIPSQVKDFPGLYGEYVLFFYAGTRDWVYYIDEQLMAFRIHPYQELASKFNLNMIAEGSVKYIGFSIKFFQDHNLMKYFKHNLISIIKLCLIYTASACYRSEKYSIFKTFSVVSRQAYYKRYIDHSLYKIIRKAYFSALYRAYLQLVLNMK